MDRRAWQVTVRGVARSPTRLGDVHFHFAHFHFPIRTYCIAQGTLLSTLTYLGDRISQFSSVTQLCPTLCDPVSHSTPGLPVHHQLPEFTQTRVD